MLSYKKIIPIALVLLFVLSIYQTSKNNINVRNDYQDQLKKAREAVQYEIIVDAAVYYEEALKIKPTLGVYIEYMDMYLDAEEYKDAKKVGEKIVSKYSNSAEAYAALGKVYYLTEKYSDLYDLYAKYKNKNLQSEDMEDMYSEVEYLYSISGQYSDAGSYSEGRCAVKNEDGWYFIDESGKKKTSNTYDWVGTYGNSIAPVLDEQGNYYFIDKSGNKKKVLNEIESVQGIGVAVEGIIPVYDGKCWNYYDMDQKLICGGYEEASTMGNGYAAVKKDGRWHIINSSGKDINDVTYSDVIMDEKGIVYRGCFFAKETTEYHMYDKNGNVIGDLAFEDADLFNVIEGESCLAAVKQKGKWGYVNMQGEMVIEPQFNDAISFRLGLAGVKDGNMWGYIDTTGKMVIEPAFLEVNDFTDSGSTVVNQGETWRLLQLDKYKD